MSIKKCLAHSDGKTCLQVITEGNCIGRMCSLFKRVLGILPKFKKMHELQARGVIPTTIWRFDEKSDKKRLRKQTQSMKWLDEFYPKIIKGLEKAEATGIEE